MAYIRDQGDPLPNQVTSANTEGFDCPTCGCNDITIEVMPERTSWFGGAGRARCNLCGSFGPLSLVELDDAGQPLPFQPPPPGSRWFGR